MDRVVLVMGGAGYIGSHTCKMLHKLGYIPVVVDNLIYGHKEFVKWGPFEEVDILNKDPLTKVFKKYKPYAVVHFAAFAYVGESVVEPAKYYTNNVTGTVNVLDAMRQVGCEKIIFSSTCATYGVPEVLPITEETKQVPINPYGRSKLMVEQILADYDRAYGVKHVALRYFNAGGADPEGESGEKHSPETHLIPLVIEAGLGKREKLTVYGNDYATQDGTAIRDYVHVTDLADAHVRAIDLLERTEKSEQLNLGSESGTSVQQVIDSANSICGLSVPYEYGPRREGDPPVLVANAEKAQKVLGWVPTLSTIESIIKTAYKWHMKSQRRRAAYIKYNTAW